MSRFVKMHVDELRLGMFIADLDRPWIGTPFLTQGFNLREVGELEVLRELCVYVQVDVGLSVPVKNQELKVPRGVSKRASGLSKIFKGKPLKTYEDSSSFQEELSSAQKVYRDYQKIVGDLHNAIAGGNRVNMDAIDETITTVVDSIVRNPDACMLLAAIRDKDSYSYSHAMASSVLAAAVGRQIGLPKSDIRILAKGALLCDVGKIKIPADILNKSTALSFREMALVRHHVAEGVQILRETDGVSQNIIDIVAHHHERFNGNGYPNRMAGERIPPFARVAGMVDCYDAMISHRAYASGVAPAAAIAKLYSMRNVEFSTELVEEFIQTIGVYPVGSLVELTDGKVGVVVAEHRRRRLRPKILLVLDSQKNPVKESTYINLLEENEHDSEKPLEILRSLEPGVYGIDVEDLFF